MPDTPATAFKKILEQFYGKNMTGVISVAVLKDNDYLNTMSMERWSLWADLANAVTECIEEHASDYSLYEYLTAIINEAEYDWECLARQSQAEDKQLFWEQVVRIANKKYRPETKPDTTEYNVAVLVNDYEHRNPVVKLFKISDSMVLMDKNGDVLKRYIAKIVAEKSGLPDNSVTWGHVIGLIPKELEDKRLNGQPINTQVKPIMLILNGKFNEAIIPKKTHEANVLISKNEATYINECLAGIKQQDKNLPIHRIVQFPDGNEMHIICRNNEGTSIAEAVLYSSDGKWLTMSEPSHSFIGTWCIEYGDMEYNAIVTVANH